MKSNKVVKQYPTTKEILYMLGVGTLIAASIVMPAAGYIAKGIMEIKEEAERKKEQKEWLRFNQSALKRNIKRLQEQKVVEIIKKDNVDVIKLTSKGRTKYLKFKLEDLSLSKPKWDGKWRIIIYDVANYKRSQQNAFRNIIKRINMLQLQKSVYITPYPCKHEIEYLREYFGIGDNVIRIRADFIENEEAYKKYFGI